MPLAVSVHMLATFVSALKPHPRNCARLRLREQGTLGRSPRCLQKPSGQLGKCARPGVGTDESTKERSILKLPNPFTPVKIPLSFGP